MTIFDNDTPASGGLREMRIAAGLSQEQLAREVDCSTAYVRVLERGYTPDPEASPVMARIIGYLQNDERRPLKAPPSKSAGQGRHDEE